MKSEPVKINGALYRFGKMDVMAQFHVSRRLGPALVICGVTFKMMLEGIKVTLDDWAAVAGPVMDIISKMPEEDVNYVIYTCLRVVERQQGDLWARVVTPAPENVFMFHDLDMAALLRLTVEVLRINLTNFAMGMTADGNSSDGSGAAHP